MRGLAAPPAGPSAEPPSSDPGSPEAEEPEEEDDPSPEESRPRRDGKRERAPRDLEPEAVERWLEQVPDEPARALRDTARAESRPRASPRAPGW